MIELYLIRHGIAEVATDDIKDEERRLTKQGRQKTEKVAQRLKKLGLHFDCVATSPLVRARQTAEILVTAGLSSHMEECTHLAPDGNIHNWVVNWLEPKNFAPDTKLA
ncbi:phosphohistidine phosphatase SixA, partial [Fischerella thermalis CCMEE 5319]